MVSDYANKPYVYFGVHRKTGEFYIGYRKANKFKSEYDFGIRYTTHSDIVKNIGFHQFDWHIAAEFFAEDRIDAVSSTGLSEKVISEYANGIRTHEELFAQYCKAKPRKRTEYVCTKCGMVGHGGNMKRYHFDNCNSGI
jgi:hypothetical protein